MEIPWLQVSRHSGQPHTGVVKSGITSAKKNRLVDEAREVSCEIMMTSKIPRIQSKRILTNHEDIQKRPENLQKSRL